MLRLFTLIFVINIFVISVSAQEKVIPNNPNYQFKSDKNQTTNSTTQKTQLPTFNPYWRFGGSFGFSFWNDGTDILVAPKAYYQLSPQFMAGFGLTYIYSDYDYRNSSYKSHAYGGSILGVYRPMPYLQLSAEFEELHINQEQRFFGSDGGTFDRDYWNSALYLGVSFVSGNFAFGLQYDVLHDDGKSPYSSAWTPVISFYF
ncbi:MAG: alpha-ketoglutarate decarboxylase [Bacteroidota bacterium]